MQETKNQLSGIRLRWLFIAVSVAVVLLLTISGTYAGSYSENFKISIDRPTVQYSIIPGFSAPMTTTVKVTNIQGQGNAYAYLKIVDESSDCVKWDIAEGWEPLESSTSGNPKTYVYYRVVHESSEQSFPIMKDNVVSYPADVTNEKMRSAGDSAGVVNLTFSAYLIQARTTSETTLTKETGWNLVNTTPTPSPTAAPEVTQEP